MGRHKFKVVNPALAELMTLQETNSPNQPLLQPTCFNDSGFDGKDPAIVELIEATFCNPLDWYTNLSTALMKN